MRGIDLDECHGDSRHHLCFVEPGSMNHEKFILGLYTLTRLRLGGDDIFASFSRKFMNGMGKLVGAY